MFKYEYHITIFNLNKEETLKIISKNNPHWDIISIDIVGYERTEIVYRLIKKELEIVKEYKSNKLHQEIVNLKNLIRIAYPIIHNNEIKSSMTGAMYDDAVKWLKICRTI